jgi:hypothetical protein
VVGHEHLRQLPRALSEQNLQFNYSPVLSLLSLAAGTGPPHLPVLVSRPSPQVVSVLLSQI